MHSPYKKHPGDNSYVISYLTLRKAVGILGMALPVVLIASFTIMNKHCILPPSISHYYYTKVGTYFTGTLCAVALFMFAYNGPDVIDKRAALFACVCALGVAFYPANPYFDEGKNCIRVSLSSNPVRNGLHYGFAGLLFLTFAFFSLVLFTKTSGEPTKEKLMRNIIYKICGWLIIACIVGIALVTLLDRTDEVESKTVNITTYVFETIALLAFGFSWLVKGKTFLKDKGGKEQHLL